jgi:putative ABC transport system ATP-binding protein
VSSPVLELASVTFSYPGRQALLDKVSLELREGDFLVVTGPSGAGKSTFLRLLCRLESPMSGEIRYRGDAVERLFAPELRRRVSYLQQVPVVLPQTVAQNLLLPFILRQSRSAAPTRKRLRDALDRVGLDQVALDAAAEELSVGQRQRLCLVRTVLTGPEVILLDEPLSALDAIAAGRVLQVLAGLNRKDGMTVVMVSHAGGKDLPGSRFVEIKDASVVEGGRPTWAR